MCHNVDYLGYMFGMEVDEGDERGMGVQNILIIVVHVQSIKPPLSISSPSISLHLNTGLNEKNLD